MQYGFLILGDRVLRRTNPVHIILYHRLFDLIRFHFGGPPYQNVVLLLILLNVLQNFLFIIIHRVRKLVNSDILRLYRLFH